MKLSSKFLFIESLVILFILVIAFFLFNNIEKNTNLLIKHDQEIFQNAAEKIFFEEIEPIVDFCSDYSLWDDTVNFVNSLDMDWAADYLDAEYFKQFNIDFVAVYSKEGSNIFVDSTFENIIPILEKINAKEFFSRVDIGNPIFKYLSSNNLLIALTYATIHPTNDVERLTPPSGYLVMGRILSQESFTHIKDILLANVQFYPYETLTEVPNHDKFTLLFRKNLKDEKGNEIGMLEISRKSIEISKLYNSLLNTVIAIIFFGLLFTIFVSISLMKTIINPLKKVTNGISEHNISAFEDLLKRNDEIGELAKATKEYLLQSDKIKQYVNELEVKANELRNANAKIRKLLETDSLTNLLSRHVLVEQFDRLIKQSKENFTPLSVIFMDLDNFKKVNDIHGHLTGDNLLKKIGEIVTSSLRESDFPIRYGGDEIIILLPNTTKENATIIAERIRKRIENELYDKYGVTASIGVTELLPSDDFDSLITRVDNLAYNSKNNKKNKVTSG